VREVLTELDLEYELRSAGKGSPRREELAKLTGGSSQCPYLIDDNTGRSLPESGAIAEYLYANYALWTPPSELLRAASGFLTPLLAPVYKLTAPLQAGSSRENEFEYASEIAEAKADIYDEISSRPVVICESSPPASPVFFGNLRNSLRLSPTRPRGNLQTRTSTRRFAPRPSHC
jgi:glutathione S-transferase